MTTTAQYGTAIYGDSLYGAITVAAASGSYTITGVSAGGIYDQVVFAGNGAYTFTGSDASLVYSQVLSASTGSYTLTGANAELVYIQPNQQVITHGGTGKKKPVIKKSQSEEIQEIVRKALNKLDGTDSDIISDVKSELETEISTIDLSHYDLAMSQVKLMILMAESKIKLLEELRAEDEDEAALLMLL